MSKAKKTVKDYLARWFFGSIYFFHRAYVIPLPGWQMGYGQNCPGMMPGMKRLMYRWIQRPCRVKWLLGTAVYLYPECEISRSILATGFYEPNELCWLNSCLSPGMICLDVGANIGLYSIFMAKKTGALGRLISFEPSKREYQRLKQNILTNKFNNVILQNCAVANEKGIASLRIAENEHAGHNTLGHFGYASVVENGTVRVPTVTLDEVIDEQRLDRLDLIKMDIEGAELHALKGARIILSKYHPVIMLELSDRTLSQQAASGNQVVNYLHDLGYDLFTFDNHTAALTPLETQSYYDAINVVAMPAL